MGTCLARRQHRGTGVPIPHGLNERVRALGPHSSTYVKKNPRNATTVTCTTTVIYKILCRFFGAPATLPCCARVFPDHLITVIYSY